MQGELDGLELDTSWLDEAEVAIANVLAEPAR